MHSILINLNSFNGSSNEDLLFASRGSELPNIDGNHANLCQLTNLFKCKIYQPLRSGKKICDIFRTVSVTHIAS